MNPFLGLFFGFSHIGKIQDGHHPKYNFGIIWDLMMVETHENTLIVGFCVSGIYFRDFFLDSAISENIKMAAT